LVAEDLKDSATVEWTSFDGSLGFETSEPANIQAILATQFDDFSVGYRRYNTFEPLVGHSIFSSDGKFWAHSRALFRPQFARENINDLEMTNKASNDLIEAIGAPQPDGWTSSAEMMPLLYNFTLDTATDFLFGESIESQKVAIAARKDTTLDNQTRQNIAAQMKEAQEFTRSFSIANEYILTRIRLQSLYFLGDSFKFRKAVRRIRKVTDHYVKLACDTASSSEKPEGKKQSLMFNLANQTQDRIELRNQTLSILLAGRDTTASLLGWALTRLALHPDVFDKLRGIVLQDFELGTDITFAQLKGCRYLQHFLNEVLRLHPTVPLNQRIAAKDTTLPTGGGADQRSPIAVKKGQIVLFSVYNMQRREKLWGADSVEFKPERWEQRFPAWQYLPFLGGPRICLGQQ
jgi:cytochrome P450